MYNVYSLYTVLHIFPGGVNAVNVWHVLVTNLAWKTVS